MNPRSITDTDTWSPLPGFLIYALMALTMLILSGWPEPPDGERVAYEVDRAVESQLGELDAEPIPSGGDIDGDAGSTAGGTKA